VQAAVQEAGPKITHQLTTPRETEAPPVEIYDLPTVSEKLKSLAADYERLRSNFHTAQGIAKAAQVRLASEMKDLEKAVSGESDTSAVKTLMDQHSALLSRITAMETKHVQKAAASQVELHSKLLTKLTNRVAAIENAKNVHPLTRMLLEKKDLWNHMGFKNEAELVKFAEDLPKALTVIAPKPEIAMNATAGKIVDIYQHLAKEEQKVVANVFPKVFGRTVEQWDSASAEEKTRSISDWIYIMLWKMVVGNKSK
jgi:hypothetical protein